MPGCRKGGRHFLSKDDHHVYAMNLRLTATYLVIAILFSLAPIRPAVAATADPKPPQVTASFIYPPSPLIQRGTAWLAYEMVITNYIPPSYTLDSIEVSAGAKKFSYSGDTLRNMTRLAGAVAQSAQSRTLEGGHTVIVFFVLDFKGASDIPTTVAHTLHM